MFRTERSKTIPGPAAHPRVSPISRGISVNVEIYSSVQDTDGKVVTPYTQVCIRRGPKINS